MRSTDALNAPSLGDFQGEQDLGPLAWVLDELRKSLDGAVKALRRFVYEAELAQGSDLAALDASPLRQVRQQLHQASGALEMVGMDSPALVLRAMEAAVQKFVQRPELCTDEAAGMLERASFALGEYLENVLAGKAVSAVALFPQYRDVQILNGVSRVHPADLWAVERRFREPELDVSAPALAYGPSARARLDQAVLKIVKHADTGAACDMRDVSLGLAAAQSDPRVRAFWKISAGFFEAFSLGLFEPDVYVKRVASRILMQYATLAKGDMAITERLVQDLLFFCAQARNCAPGKAPALDAVRKVFALERFPAVDYEARRFGRFDPAVLAQARKRVTAAAETWSALAGGDRHKFKPTADQFSLVCDSLRKLQPGSEGLAQALTRAVDMTVRSGEPPAAGLAMEVATSVLYLQAALEELDAPPEQLAQRARRLAERLDRVCAGAEPEPLEHWMEELYRRVSDHQTMGSVVGELRATLAEAERAMDQFFRDPHNMTPLATVPTCLAQMRGVLSVLGLEQASLAVTRMRETVEHLLSGQISGDGARHEAFEKLGNSLGALGFMIDMLSYQRALARKLFVYDGELGELRSLMGREQVRNSDTLQERPQLREESIEVLTPGSTPTPESLRVPEPEQAPAAPSETVPSVPENAQPPAGSVGAPQFAAPVLTAAADALPAQDLLPLPAAEETNAADQKAPQVPLPAPAAAQTALPQEQLPAPSTAEEAYASEPAAVAVSHVSQPILDDELLEIFLEEVREVAVHGKAALQRLAAEPDNLSEQTTLRRAFHTLKGSSRMVGLHEFGEAAWAVEQVLNLWLAEQKPMPAPLLQLAAEALQGLGCWADEIQADGASAWQAAAFIRAAEALRDGKTFSLELPAMGSAEAAQAQRDDAPQVPTQVAGEAEKNHAFLAEESESSNRKAAAGAGAASIASETPVDGMFLPDAHLHGAGTEEAGAPVLAEADADSLLPLTDSTLQESAEGFPDFLSVPGTDTNSPETQEANTGLPVSLEIAEEIDFSDFSQALASVDATAADDAQAALADGAFGSEFLAESAEHKDALNEASLDAAEPDSLPGLSEWFDAEPLAALGVPPPSLDFLQAQFESAVAVDVDGVQAPADLPLPDALPTGTQQQPGQTQQHIENTETAKVGEAVDFTESAVLEAKAPSSLDTLSAATAVGVPDPASTAEPAPTVPPDEYDKPGNGESADSAAEDEDDATKAIGSLRIGIPLYNVYLNEADEWSRRLVTELQEWSLELHRPVPDAAIALAHSMAGSSATVGFMALSETARLLEHALAHVQSQSAGLPAQAQTFLAASEDMRRLLHQFAAGFLKHANADVQQQLRLILDTEPVVAPYQQAIGTIDGDLHPDQDIDQDIDDAIARAVAAVSDMDDDIDALDVIDPDLFQFFEDEALELLPSLGSALRQWAARPNNLGARNEVLRALHTLKGSSRLAGAMRLGEMAHRMESAIEQLDPETVRSQDIEPLLVSFDGLQSNFDALRIIAAQSPAQTPIPAQTLAPKPKPLPAHPVRIAGVEETALPVPAVPKLAARPAPLHASAGQSVRVRAQLLDRLINQAGEVMITRSRLDARLGQLKGSMGDLSGNLDRLRQQLRDIEVQSESQMQSRLALARDSGTGFDPLEFDRFTRVQELTRMMAESVNDVATVQRNLQRAIDGTEDDLIAQGRQARELQRDLLRTRMVEFEGISERLYAVVRQASKETGKQIKLDITGGSIEMDRGVLDRMTPAFEHLLRNCVAHGIETPELRRVAGKPAAGTITVALQQEGNDVAVEFRDDGAGLDVERIRAKALAQGLVAAGAQVGEAEAAQLIFAPGFTTASTVTEISGRGIGMDVVLSEVNALGGRIETTTLSGQGSAFRMVLPLTTAVTQVVMLRMGSSSIGVPASLIEVVRRVPAAEVQAAYRSSTFDVGGEAVPFYWAGQLMQVSPRSSEPAPGKTLPVVVLRSAAQRIAMHVDEVLGNQEVVVKNLGPQLARMPGLAGMSVLASGAVVLIYNPVALSAVYGEQLRSADLAQQANADAVALPGDGNGNTSVVLPLPAQGKVPLVLVVDDSITVRRVTQRLLQREGYRVALAADGLQAIERLQEERPVVVLSDIEMPRMDGFDLARNIRADAALADLPIIMITSRIAQKHRDLAMELGVDHYLGKPYSDEKLLGLVQQYCLLAAQAEPA